ncbi:bifunctional diaminohydroxyphosphoribosylaminopyrimidine deaminase/5-amino-6-(5-phosphoribosylamino)uracil reductase RibD [Arenibacter sp. GZD96]|uniref:bifunctional diaminohydroxyphosphoribosylaminopyrimidine deaminase/5-amino-6-(5-phosphoribosylamino)uracil reductase RibD n=1 Tax=Aurantibrevibacter litoralis TaxID=3106030 RepID=UPI002AFF0483|nr:bifunctional diaminohydroxyphosphoribosylaminopyrimidine deaminase/5-amino-6-(5-phosphoribosylamino)uracil reductase RibD [Arenibacter sp. GZD-96]MEA1786329.1 bifunctional diaminohydroxyphosphoribosylaminopyrimidine deaminase/5-amino-6-(5-phosphoribosylamino)uracil reductase RibD [Arenibacter sp. GZD-96]
MKIHEKYISRCIQLAKNGWGTTFPNPMVGCVIVHNKRIIGEGFTSPFGGPHAEVNAINSVADVSLLADATLYVSLEPCSHFGKTPPCADYIVAHGIRKVVVGILDPHEKVAGQGVQKLKDAGCHVTVGILAAACKEHHRRFLTFHTQKRPYIILKWAQTIDGFIAPDKRERSVQREPYWISNAHSRQRVHQWRSQEQGILVGTSTVLQDNPRLDLRLWNGKPPIRIIIDKDLKIEGDFYVLDNTVPTIIITQIANSSRYKEGIRYEVIDFSKEITTQICALLYQHQILSLIIEGGAITLQAFIDSHLWDEARIFTGATVFGSGTRAPELRGATKSIEKIGSDQLTIVTHD